MKKWNRLLELRRRRSKCESSGRADGFAPSSKIHLVPDPDRAPWIDAVSRELRQPVALSDDFDRRVMARLRRSSRVRRTSVRGLLRAAAVAAAFAATAGAVWMASQMPVASESAAVVPDTGAAEPIQFVVVAPDAAEVSLVGDFNNWDAAATPMHRESAGGIWAVTVPLSTGRYQYAFVVDGTEWRLDPLAPAAPVDDFGVPNSIIAVADRAS